MNSLYLLIEGLLILFILACQDPKRPDRFKSSIALPQEQSPSLGNGPIIVRNFKPVALAPDFDTTLVSQYIRSIFEDSKGNFWFGTIEEGVVRYDAHPEDGKEKSLTYFSHPEGFYNQTVYAINEDKKGTMWFGTDQGVYTYDGNTFRNYKQNEGLNHIDITRKGILVDRSGNIWVGTHGGVYRYDCIADSKGKNSFSLFKLLPSMNVTGILEDKTGNIWFSSSDKGIYKYNPMISGKKAITHIPAKEGFSDNYAGGIAEDKDGNIWFTMKDGISKYSPSAAHRTGGKNFTEYTAKDGIGGTEIWGIYIEQSGIIWITARGSTTRFDPSIPQPDSKAFTVYTSADGLTCCVQSMYQDRSGRMWWGTGQGIYRYKGYFWVGSGQRFFQVKKNGPW